MALFQDRNLRVAAAGALLVAGCGSGQGGAPTTPPVATATPFAGPTPGPPLSASCERLPPGSASYACRDVPAEFLHPVLDAIATLRNEQPEIFDGKKIRNAGLYYVGLIRILDRSDLCAAFDGAELAVKNSAEFSEQYRVQTSWGEIRTVNTYMGACFPAVFPLARGAPGQVRATRPRLLPRQLLPRGVLSRAGRMDAPALSVRESARAEGRPCRSSLTSSTSCRACASGCSAAG